MNNKHITGKDGIAMVAVMVMSAITLAVMAGLVYMVTTGTSVSGGGKRHSIALEAAQGCIPLTSLMIDKGGDPLVSGVTYIQQITPACLIAKRRDGTDTWPMGCNNSAVKIDPSDTTSYDVSFDIGATDPYRCYVKIVNTNLLF